MNMEQAAGIYAQVAGRLNQAWGDLAGNPMRAADGRRQQIAGKLQQRKGDAKQEYARQLRDFLQRNRNWRF